MLTTLLHFDTLKQMTDFNYLKNEDESGPINSTLISDCCHAASLGPVEEDAYGHLVGICSECHKQTEFSKDFTDDL
jgi:hypothetical protein